MRKQKRIMFEQLRTLQYEREYLHKNGEDVTHVNEKIKKLLNQKPDQEYSRES